MIELQAGRERPGIRARLSANHPLIRELKLKVRVWSRGRDNGACAAECDHCITHTRFTPSYCTSVNEVQFTSSYFYHENWFKSIDQLTSVWITHITQHIWRRYRLFQLEQNEGYLLNAVRCSDCAVGVSVSLLYHTHTHTHSITFQIKSVQSTLNEIIHHDWWLYLFFPPKSQIVMPSEHLNMLVQTYKHSISDVWVYMNVFII